MTRPNNPFVSSLFTLTDRQTDYKIQRLNLIIVKADLDKEKKYQRLTDDDAKASLKPAGRGEGLYPRGASKGMLTISQPKQTQSCASPLKKSRVLPTKTTAGTYHTSVLLYLRMLHLVHRNGVSVFYPNFD